MARATDSESSGSSPRAEVALGERTGYLLHRVMMLLEARFEQGLRAIDLKARDYFVLAALTGDVPLSQQDLSRLLGLDPTTVVAAIDDLERRKYVERRRNPADRRRYNLVLTTAGRKALKQGDRVATEAEEAVLGVLDAKEKRALNEMLSRVMSG